MFGGQQLDIDNEDVEEFDEAEFDRIMASGDQLLAEHNHANNNNHSNFNS